MENDGTEKREVTPCEKKKKRELMRLPTYEVQETVHDAYLKHHSSAPSNLSGENGLAAP